MATAFVTIKAQVGQVKEILDKLQKIENVIEAHAITGAFDIIIKIKGDNLEQITKMVVTKIPNDIPRVQDTVTYLVIDI
ncbi:MAG TPA: Lrp/AsnC ligand binding domain-containing protein [Candidatus Deferrimicrobium sp.]|nr:Lrp/AsnC ligand binding domain-containing protein [Candidatus Deferrimicrobium sp.]